MTALLPAPAPAAADRQTSVPVWPVAAPALDATGRAFLLVAVGPAAEPVVADWAAGAVDQGRPVQRMTVDGRTDDRALADLVRRLDQLGVGARLAVCGPEADVLAVAAAARRVGLLPEEIATFAVDRGDLSVFCVHCEVTSRMAAAPGAEVTCPGCRRRIEVHEHVSGHRGSYLASAIALPEGDA
ncbi:dimethylamine monooxygenase subunit DmmA family protein [Modestobacter excelsi]|uniref:dimethylamine monooxygenase subunit DmmA family protein n=1 Tax=Modestobacter excelsi TaxID=2213161 RepID=UPI00110CC078|nr:dimethylamine monooxygenase subunit DmmA family protein [Modestobacter excelsi]